MPKKEITEMNLNVTGVPDGKIRTVMTCGGVGTRQDIVLKKDLVIKAGTKFMQAPTNIKLIGEGHYEALIGLSPDSSGAIRYDTCDMDNFDEWFEVIE